MSVSVPVSQIKSATGLQLAVLLECTAIVYIVLSNAHRLGGMHSRVYGKGGDVREPAGKAT